MGDVLESLSKKGQKPPKIFGKNQKELIQSLVDTFVDIEQGKYRYVKRKPSQNVNTLKMNTTIADCGSTLRNILSTKDNRQYIAHVLVNYIIQEFFDKSTNKLY